MSFGRGGRDGGGCGGARAPTLSLTVVGFGADVRESFAPIAGVSSEMPRIVKIKKKVNCSFIVGVCTISRQQIELPANTKSKAIVGVEPLPIYVRRDRPVSEWAW